MAREKKETIIIDDEDQKIISKISDIRLKPMYDTLSELHELMSAIEEMKETTKKVLETSKLEEDDVVSFFVKKDLQIYTGMIKSLPKKSEMTPKTRITVWLNNKTKKTTTLENLIFIDRLQDDYRDEEDEE